VTMIMNYWEWDLHFYEIHEKQSSLCVCTVASKDFVIAFLTLQASKCRVSTSKNNQF